MANLSSFSANFYDVHQPIDVRIAQGRNEYTRYWKLKKRTLCNKIMQISGHRVFRDLITFRANKKIECKKALMADSHAKRAFLLKNN